MDICAPKGIRFLQDSEFRIQKFEREPLEAPFPGSGRYAENCTIIARVRSQRRSNCGEQVGKAERLCEASGEAKRAHISGAGGIKPGREGDKARGADDGRSGGQRLCNSPPIGVRHVQIEQHDVERLHGKRRQRRSAVVYANNTVTMMFEQMPADLLTNRVIIGDEYVHKLF
jgi:hypothetical protein